MSARFRADLCYMHSVLLTGYTLIPDAAEIPTKKALQQRILAEYPDNTEAGARNRSGYFRLFLHEMKPGDFVVTPEKGRIHVCRITGDHYFSNDPATVDYMTAEPSHAK